MCPSDKYSSRNTAYWILSVGSRLKRLSNPLNRLRADSRESPCYLTFALWLEVWLYIYPETFETCCLKSDARKCFPPLYNYPVARKCRPFTKHDWHVRVIPHWLRTRETNEPLRRSIWCCKRSAKIQPSHVFWRVGALKTWLDQCISDSKTTPLRLKHQYLTICEIVDQLNECCAEKLNLSRAEETAGILSVIWSVTMHSIAAVYELSRDCNWF